MRIKLEPPKKPVVGNERLRSAFLFFPKVINGELRWWESAKWWERYTKEVSMGWDSDVHEAYEVTDYKWRPFMWAN